MPHIDLAQAWHFGVAKVNEKLIGRQGRGAAGTQSRVLRFRRGSDQEAER